MIKVSIVEDAPQDQDMLRTLIDEWNNEHGHIIGYKVYPDAVSFLENGAMNSDIVFMDIRMPHMNGMDAAEKLREMNSYPILIFLTTLAGYAIRGYSVDAMDFVLKPIEKEKFTKTFERAIKRLEQKKRYISLNTKGATRRVATDEVTFIEAFAHDKIFHVGNSTFTVYDDMEKIMNELPPEFVRCHRSYIVNLRCVEAVGKDTVKLIGETTLIPVSRNRREQLVDALTEFYAKNM